MTKTLEQRRTHYLRRVKRTFRDRPVRNKQGISGPFLHFLDQASQDEKDLAHFKARTPVFLVEGKLVHLATKAHS